jgi:hypothetical protein
MSKQDVRTIICGLLPDGLDVSRLTSGGRQEIRDAIDTVLRMTEIVRRQHG